MHSHMIKQRTERTKMSRKKILLIVFVILLFDLIVSGYLKFGYYVAKCGGVPVAIVPGAAIGRPSYILPGNYTPGWAATQYICTEQEAIDNGIAKNLYRN